MESDPLQEQRERVIVASVTHYTTAHDGHFRHHIRTCPPVVAALRAFEDAAIAWGKAQMRCYHLNCCGRTCNDPDIAKAIEFQPPDHWEPCPSCTARAALAETTST